MKKLVALMFVGVLVFAVGCKKQDTSGTSSGAGKGTETIDFADEPEIRSGTEENANLKTINFAFDKSEITSEAAQILQANADYVLKNSKMKIAVEGHCDDRGTIEYNLSLGQRRAMKVKEHYVSLGVAANRIATISYGKERPVDSAENEAAYSKNRRAETKVIK